MGRPDLTEAQFADGGAGPRAELEAIFASRSRDEWAAFAALHDVCLMPVLEGDEPRLNPHLSGRGSFIAIDTPWEGRPMESLASPVRIVGVEAPRRPAPALGADTEAVLSEAGFDPSEVAALRASGAIG